MNIMEQFVGCAAIVGAFGLAATILRAIDRNEYVHELALYARDGVHVAFSVAFAIVVCPVLALCNAKPAAFWKLMRDEIEALPGQRQQEMRVFRKRLRKERLWELGPDDKS